MSATATTYPIAEMRRRYEAGESQNDIAASLGVSQSSVSRRLRLLGVKSRTVIGVTGSRHPSWRGGRTISGSGYVWVRSDEFPEMVTLQGYVPEHRLVMARRLGRALLPDETVHHRDGDRQNNDISNLELHVGRHGKGASSAHCRTCSCFNHVED